MKIKATFAYKSSRLDKALLNDIYVDGELFRSHSWIEFKPFMKNLSNGDVIEFTAKYHNYVGLDKVGNYVQKKGFKQIRNLRKC